jgi:hypothetical protein
MIKKFLFIAFTTTTFLFKLPGQDFSLAEKTELLNRERDNLEEITNQRLTISKFFVNGILYTETFPPTIHPYFEENKWEDGKLLYGDQLVDIRGIKYDMVNDQLIYMNIREDESNPVILTPNYCKEFYMNQHHFRYLNTNLNGNSAASLKPGYYEVIYDGDTKFYVKWEKISKLDNVDAKQVMEVYYSLYVFHNSRYTKVKNKRKLLKVLQDREKELKDFIEQEKIVFSKENYSVSKRILEYYDNLTE